MLKLKKDIAKEVYKKLITSEMDLDDVEKYVNALKGYSELSGYFRLNKFENKAFDFLLIGRLIINKKKFFSKNYLTISDIESSCKLFKKKNDLDILIDIDEYLKIEKYLKPIVKFKGKISKEEWFKKSELLYKYEQVLLVRESIKQKKISSIMRSIKGDHKIISILKKIKSNEEKIKNNSEIMEKLDYKSRNSIYKTLKDFPTK